jgi:hypothetical protein
MIVGLIVEDEGKLFIRLYFCDVTLALPSREANAKGLAGNDDMARIEEGNC